MFCLSSDEREACFARLRARETQVLVNVDICTEGFDFPALGCVILARPTKSIVRFLQSVGRVMRPAPGKVKAVCLDHAGSFLEHGFPSDPRYFGLDAGTPKVPAELCPCPQCSALMRKGAGRCEACGWQEPVTEIEDYEKGAGAGANDDSDELVLLRPEERRSCPACGGYQVRIIQNERLGAFTYGVECRARDCAQRVQWVKDTEGARQAPEAAKRREWERLKQMCFSKGWALRWAIKQYQELFGAEPDWT